MSFYFIGWLISLFLWIVFMIGLIISDKKNDYDMVIRFNILQVATLVPMWIFVFLIRSE